MNVKKISARVSLMLISCLSVIAMFSAINSPVVDSVYAQSIEDDLSGYSSSTGNDVGGDVMGQIANQPINEDDQGVIDWMTGQRTLTSEQLQTASRTMRPVTAIIGYVTGGIIVLTIAGVTLITALDLLYIAIPPVRGILYNGNAQGAGAMGGAMGGMGMGRGMSGMYGGMAGATGAMGATGGKKIQWVSDEAISCAQMVGAGAQTAGAGMGMAQSQQQQTTGSVIGTYFRKRIFFLLLLALCIIVLTSSVVLDCGINLAEWVLKILSMINSKM